MANRPANHGVDDDSRGGVTAEGILLSLSTVVCVFVILAFGLDLLFGWPFNRHSLLMDVGYLSIGGVFGYLIWLGYHSLR